MKTITKIILASSVTLFSQFSFAINELSTVMYLEKDCKYYVTRGPTGFHVIGAINHNPPPKNTKIIGDYANLGYQDMKVGEDSETVYMDIAYNKGGSIEDAKKELEFKCLESK